MAYPKASEFGGQLNVIPNDWLYITNSGEGSDDKDMTIYFQSMPIITDSKGAKYDPSPVQGRSTPILTYANSDLRTISLDLPFLVTSSGSDSSTVGTVAYNLKALKAIMSSVYPRRGGAGVTYRPPPVCVLQYGNFLWDGSLCVTIDKYSVNNVPSVPSDPTTLCPFKITVSINCVV